MNFWSALRKAENEAAVVVKAARTQQNGLLVRERRLMKVINRYSALKKVYHVERELVRTRVNGRIVFEPQISFAHRPEGAQKRHYVAYIRDNGLVGWTNLPTDRIGRRCDYSLTARGLVRFVRRELLELAK